MVDIFLGITNLDYNQSHPIDHLIIKNKITILHTGPVCWKGHRGKKFLKPNYGDRKVIHLLWTHQKISQ